MLYGQKPLEDQRYFLEQVFLPAVERERPDCILLAGDIYDRQIAPPEAIRLFDRTLSRLTELNCKVAVISGNHDGSDRIAILKKYFKKERRLPGHRAVRRLLPHFFGGWRRKSAALPFTLFRFLRRADYFQDDTLREKAPVWPGCCPNWNLCFCRTASTSL